MTEKIQKGDFVELDYTGKLADGMIFDTTIESVAKENNLHSENAKYKSAIVCVGESQLLPGLDDSLPNHNVGEEFEVTLPPEKAFGKRDVKNMRIVPINTFKEHNVQPQPGLTVDVDGQRGTISRVSGGRIIVNFNHPLAGKEVIYQVIIRKKVTDVKEQITSFLNTTLQIPSDKVKIEVNEEKATVFLPMDLPPQIVEPLSNKLSELVKLKGIEFKKK